MFARPETHRRGGTPRAASTARGARSILSATRRPFDDMREEVVHGTTEEAWPRTPQKEGAGGGASAGQYATVGLHHTTQ